ncbi:MAG: energy-coupling factor transporter transmembrane protein EcfT [Propionibacteriaceae bacterium]|nr:energy-coupling factor transporter transmembrane protein EcfT [Propionibacteriaceae bacterium]
MSTTASMAPRRSTAARSLTRPLHPGAWWVWALGCAVVASRTSNPLLLALIIAVVCFTVVARRSSAPWALAFRLYVYVGIFVVLMRMLLRIVFSADGPTIIWNLPTLSFPGVFSSVRLFGPVSAEVLVASGASGLQLATIILGVGAANSLANPKRLLAAVPGALYEWGTVVVIALTIFPQLAQSIVRVRRARQLRADTGKGVHLIRYVAMPVLNDALDRSLLLAGAMDSRGYGRSTSLSQRSKHVTTTLLLTSSVALSVGAYGLLDTGKTPVWMGAPMVILGLGLGLTGLRLSGRRVVRSRYRPDTMGTTEWLVMGSAGLGVVLSMVMSWIQPFIAYPVIQPLTWPSLSFLALATACALLIPALVAPQPELRRVS